MRVFALRWSRFLGLFLVLAVGTDHVEVRGHVQALSEGGHAVSVLYRADRRRVGGPGGAAVRGLGVGLAGRLRPGLEHADLIDQLVGDESAQLG